MDYMQNCQEHQTPGASPQAEALTDIRVTVGDTQYNLKDVGREDLTNGFMYNLFITVRSEKIKWKDVKTLVSKKIPEVAALSEITLRNACENIKHKRRSLQTRPNFSSNLEKYFDELFTVPVPSSRKRKCCTDESDVAPLLKKKLSFEEDVALNINKSLLRDSCRLQDQVTTLQREMRQHTEANKYLQDRYDQLEEETERQKQQKARTAEPRRLNEKIKRKTKQAEQWRRHYLKLKQQQAHIETLKNTVGKLETETGELKKQQKKERRQAHQAKLKYEEELATKTRGSEAVLAEKRGLVKEISMLNDALSDLDNQKAELQDSLDSIKAQQQQSDSELLPTKFDKRTYGDRVRQ